MWRWEEVGGGGRRWEEVGEGGRWEDSEEGGGWRAARVEYVSLEQHFTIEISRLGV